MKSAGLWVTLLLVIAASAAGGYWLGRRGGGGGGAAAAGKGETPAAPEAKDEDKPVASVAVVPVRRGTLSEEVTAYGVVVAPASEVRVVSVPFESRVTKVLVVPGQVVAAGDALAEVEGSAATALAVEEARNAADAAGKDLELVQQRYDQKLATNADLFAARNARQTAEGRLQSLRQGGAGKPQGLKAEAAGVVSKVDVQVGQIVPVGGPLVEVAARNRIEVKLGVEPEDAGALRAGQAVALVRVGDPAAAPVAGTVRLVAQRVDPASRLVDVTVSLPPDAKLMLESFVAGRMTRASAGGLVVPREAVLPAEEGGYTLFTVKDGHAVKHVVKVGVETDRLAQVLADDVKEGDLAVIVGNFELEGGMTVEVHEAPVMEPATEPSGAPASGPAPATTGPVSDARTGRGSPAAVPTGIDGLAPRSIRMTARREAASGGVGNGVGASFCVAGPAGGAS